MISQKNRFHGLGSVRAVGRGSQKARGELFSIRYKKNPRRNEYRLAVVVSKKTQKSAVARNRMRRRIYELFREIEKQISVADIVVIVHSDQVATIEHTKLKNALIHMLQKTGVYNKPSAKK